MANYLVTGAAGFIGSRVAEMLIKDGHTVVGCDNLNNAYDVRVKNWRLERLRKLANFKFQQLDISKRAELKALTKESGGDVAHLDGVINLAARAGVRHRKGSPSLCWPPLPACMIEMPRSQPPKTLAATDRSNLMPQVRKRRRFSVILTIIFTISM